MIAVWCCVVKTRKRALDQESPGSIPGGAIENTSREWGVFVSGHPERSEEPACFGWIAFPYGYGLITEGRKRRRHGEQFVVVAGEDSTPTPTKSFSVAPNSFPCLRVEAIAVHAAVSPA